MSADIETPADQTQESPVEETQDSVTEQGSGQPLQGVRILVMSMVPSLIGPFIGAAVIIDADEFYLHLGVLKQVPTPGIFLAAAITLSIIVIYVVFMLIIASRGGL